MELTRSVIISLLLTIVFPVISSFSTNYILAPPGACQNKKTPSHFTESSLQENRSESALITDLGRRFQITRFSRWAIHSISTLEKRSTSLFQAANPKTRPY